MRILRSLIAVLGLSVVPTSAFANDLPKEFQAFLKDFPPGQDVRPYAEEFSPELQKHGHPTLIAFWKQVGFGSFGDGFLMFFNPKDYETILSRWLLQEKPDPTRIPFARTAFGDLIYFRDLRDKAGENGLPQDWETGSDVAFLSIHYRNTDVISWSMDGFFADDLQQFLRSDTRSFYDLYAMVNKQQLGSDQCYYFVPALALGGNPTKDSVGHGDCRTHQEILLQMALGKAQ